MPTNKNSHAARTRTRHMGIVLSCLAIGMLLRWMWIFPLHPWTTVENFKQQYVYSDMYEYWNHAEKLHSAAPAWNSKDAIFPAGTGMWYAVLLGPQMDRIGVLQLFQWMTSVSIMAFIYCLARMLVNKRTAAIALFFSAVSFPLFDYSAYTLSENPFTFLLLGASLLLALAMRRQSIVLVCAAGIVFGISALFKSVGLLAGLMSMLMLFSHQWKVTRLHRACDCLLFTTAMAIIIIPASLTASARNGAFTVIANDAARYALTNHDNLLGVVFPLPDGQEFKIVTPPAITKNFTEMRTVQKGENILLENARWVAGHPRMALLGVVERVTDLFGDTRAFPTGFTSYRGIVYFSQLFMLLAICAPALGWLFLSFRHLPAAERHAMALIILPVLGLLGTVLIAAMEPRYLHPFLPFLIILAGRYYAEYVPAHRTAPQPAALPLFAETRMAV